MKFPIENCIIFKKEEEERKFTALKSYRINIYSVFFFFDNKL